jgi:hypothetical protein
MTLGLKRGAPSKVGPGAVAPNCQTQTPPVLAAQSNYQTSTQDTDIWFTNHKEKLADFVKPVPHTKTLVYRQRCHTIDVQLLISLEIILILGT